MIGASKSRLFNALFFRYNAYYLLRRHFRYVGLSGELDPLPRTGLLYLMNHSSWWDGLIVYHAICTCSQGDHYVMMDERQLARYSFFRKLGAFSIDKSSTRGIVRSLDYAAELLSAGKRVWMFPQGDIRHLESRPLEFKSGAAYLLRSSPAAAVMTMTAYYSLCHHQKAEVTLQAAAPLMMPWNEMERRSISAVLRKRLNEQLEAHKQSVVQSAPLPSPEYAALLRGGRSTSDHFDSMKRVLGSMRHR
ncbi:lysophospholipid acyltransferase family protein [Paenibacillus pinihumi]|uniref:lysophospholipid acyltransferase family protein n=1 Tax=Paenibacillus pinihumi TaxID=669462 RepID=UPI0003FFC596|nr:lysophospholipid acyltransferase family protein [Paenibacillus pinihumi]